MVHGWFIRIIRSIYKDRIYKKIINLLDKTLETVDKRDQNLSLVVQTKQTNKV